jgi:hypothetical protein
MKRKLFIQTIFSVTILAGLFFTPINPAHASCGGVYRVTLWETDSNSDVIFLTTPLDDEAYRAMTMEYYFKDGVRNFYVEKVFKGDIKAGQSLSIHIPALASPTSIPRGGVFKAPRSDGLIVAKYINGNLHTITLPEGGCADIDFTHKDMDDYFASPLNLKRFAAFLDYFFGPKLTSPHTAPGLLTIVLLLLSPLLIFLGLQKRHLRKKEQ